VLDKVSTVREVKVVCADSTSCLRDAIVLALKWSGTVDDQARCSFGETGFEVGGIDIKGEGGNGPTGAEGMDAPASAATGSYHRQTRLLREALADTRSEVAQTADYDDAHDYP